ncbi:MAG: tyrosine-type recombinase/integrase, partial [Candidatus Omnitrophica bacterium]|nr:tyrosine-type recombinase/integrase [Candidatus Omnitrophota bacterium]
SVAMMRQFFRYLQENENLTSIQQLKEEHVKAWQTYLTFEKFPRKGRNKGKRNLTRNTLACRFVTLRNFLRIMYQEKLLPFDYCSCIVVPKRRKPLPKNIPTPEQMRQIIQAAVPDNPLGIRDRFMMELMYATGIRNTEIRTALVGDLNIQERTLFVRGKGSKERLVPVGAWVMPYALEHLHTARPYLIRNTKAKLMFPTRNGWPIDSSMLHKIVNYHREKAGLSIKISPHIFRHACATHMIQQGADIRYVQELLGHEDLGSTQIYTKVTIGDLKKAHEKYHPANRDDF